MGINSDAVYSKILADLDPYLNDSKLEFEQDGPPIHVKKTAAQYLASEFLRKKETYNKTTEYAAFNTFMASNDKCLQWVSPYQREDLSEADMLLWGTFTSIVENFFYEHLGEDVALSWPNIVNNARCGPGAAIGANGPSFYAKMFAGPLTATTEHLIHVYKADIALWPEFSNAENIRQENVGSPVIVPGSRVSFVPKTSQTARMICVEPVVNMYLQLGAGEIIAKRLLRFFGIDLQTQPSINRYMAFMGSKIDSTFGDGFATIDLHAASDSLSLGLMGQILPSEVLTYLVMLRSGSTSVRGKFVPAVDVKLNMMSTMGNGFTFPLQTALFACAASACLSLDDPDENPAHHLSRWSVQTSFGLNRAGSFSVFGDDIVIRSKYSARLLRLLSLMGCEPNMKKTFWAGSFRESCGHDYLDGYNIRPVFLRKLENEKDTTVLINLLNEWSTRVCISLPKTIDYLVKGLEDPFLVPLADSDDAGVRCPFEFLTNSIGLTYPGLYVNENGSFAYNRRTSVPLRVRIDEGKVHTPKGIKRLIYNPSGLMMAYLKGEIRSGCISVSNINTPMYRTKKAVTPNWDFCPQTLEARLTGLEPSRDREFTTRFALNFLPTTIQYLRRRLQNRIRRDGRKKVSRPSTSRTRKGPSR